MCLVYGSFFDKIVPQSIEYRDTKERRKNSVLANGTVSCCLVRAWALPMAAGERKGAGRPACEYGIWHYKTSHIPPLL